MDPVEPPEKRTILLAEDQQAVRHLCFTILTRHGYQVLVANDGNHALEVAEAHPGPIHLLLSDVMMPGLDGPGLAQRILAVRPDTRVVLMSAYSEEMLPLLDGVPFLRKPFRSAALVQAIGEALAHPPKQPFGTLRFCAS